MVFCSINSDSRIVLGVFCRISKRILIYQMIGCTTDSGSSCCIVCHTLRSCRTTATSVIFHLYSRAADRYGDIFSNGKICRISAVSVSISCSDFRRTSGSSCPVSIIRTAERDVRTTGNNRIRERAGNRRCISGDRRSESTRTIHLSSEIRERNRRSIYGNRYSGAISYCSAAVVA